MKYQVIEIGQAHKILNPPNLNHEISRDSSKKSLNPWLVLFIGIGTGLYMGYIIGSNFSKLKVNPQ
jgi:hypothetical protein